MKISIITLFPDMFESVLNTSILKRAQQKGLVEYELINLRDFGTGSHQIVDDSPYGGGAGMVLKADILAEAVRSVIPSAVEGSLHVGRDDKYAKVILTSASGTTYTQQKARALTSEKHIIIICGHYEGVDQRFIDNYVDEEISIGDYVLTGGELPAMILADSITRLISGVLEKEGATENESHENGLLEHPHYTRPEEFEGIKVPEILVSGNHKKIAEWRQEQSIEKTKKVRPDLLKG